MFTDCLHLLTFHEPGNAIHVVPGGSVDYFLVSARDGRVMDCAGIKLQTLDTTGNMWPAMQRLLKTTGLSRDNQEGLDGRQSESHHNENLSQLD